MNSYKKLAIVRDFILYDLSPLVLIFILINRFFGPSLYGINDDAFISWLITGEEAQGNHRFSVYTGYFYGIYLQTISNIFPNQEWHGITQIVLIGINFILLSNLVGKKIDSFEIKLFIRLYIYTFFAWYLLNPTYTMTATLLGIGGFIFFYLALNCRNKKNFFLLFILSILSQFFSYQIRPDSFFLSVIVVIGLVAYHIIVGKKKFTKIIIVLQNIILMALFIALDKLTLNNELEKSRAWQKYFDFNNYYSTIKTNPAELVMYQKISNDQIPEMNWNYSDALVFQANAFYDERVFSSESLSQGLQQIQTSLGISGVLNRGFFPGLARTLEYLQNSLALVIVFLLSSLFIFGTRKKFKTKITFTLACISPTLLVFFYLGAGSRLPSRVYLPVLVMLTLFMILFILIEYKYLNVNILVLIQVVLTISSVIFIFSEDGIIKISKKNRMLENSRIENINLLKSLDYNGIFIGDIEVFYEQAAYAYKKPPISEIRYLSSGWFTFSPNWYLKLFDLGLQKNDVYLSIAQQPGVYWVSDPFTAEVLNMYMNDREIFRKNKCAVADLHRGLKVYTYQSEKICED